MKTTNYRHSTLALLILILFMGNHYTFGQVIKGSVVNKIDREVIAFVTIYSPRTGTGTLTNENGDFELPIVAFPARLVISHISFQTDTIVLTEPTANYVVELKPAVHELASVTISNAGYKLIQQAYDRIQADQGISFGKAFYRQLTKNGDQPTEIQEVVYGVKMSPNKIEGVNIDNARFARLPSDNSKMYFNFVNFSYLLLGQNATSNEKPSAGRVLLPVRADVVDYYDVRVIDIITQANGEKIAELDCQVREGYSSPALSGELFINMTTHNLVKLHGVVKNDLGAAINDDKVQTKNYTYIIDIDYANRVMGNYFNTIQVTAECDQLIKSTGVVRKDKVSAFLLINDLSSTKPKTKFKPINIHREDLKLIQRAKYNPEFWRSNPVVRRTPLEENIISAFEKQGVMGNMTFDDI